MIQKFFSNVFSLSTLTLVTALTLSGIAAWYSILGLMAIFAGAVLPIIIMGSSLEVGKVVATMWLQRHWGRCGALFKLYLVPAVLALAFLTSMGIFGFLSKAHIDHSVPSGDIASQIALIDEKIKIERENIDNARALIAQLDGVVNALTTGADREGRRRDGSSFTISSAERALTTRRSQAKDRAALTKQIETSQQSIIDLQKEKAPISSSLRQAEAEVGPIKYIAALVYGDNPDKGLLEKAVRWVIILIVFVFDPLALALVLAANASYRWIREDDPESPVIPTPVPAPVVPPTPIQEVPPIKEPQKSEPILVEEPKSRQVKGQGDVELAADIAEFENMSGRIITEGVTKERGFKELPYDERPGDYVVSHGKQIHRAALKEKHPEFFVGIEADSANQSNTNFGTSFPRYAHKGDTFVRVDLLPNKVYKFDGVRWIELVKTENTTQLNDEYIQYLIAQIDSGAYPVNLLTDREKSRIEEYLKK